MLSRQPESSVNEDHLPNSQGKSGSRIVSCYGLDLGIFYSQMIRSQIQI